MNYSMLKPSLEIAKNPEVDYKEMTETAGFLPLDVRLKQLEQQGYIARFNREEFDTDEITELWTRPDFEILPEDELEDIQEKLNLRRAYLLDLAQKHQSIKKDQSQPKKESVSSADEPAEEK